MQKFVDAVIVIVKSVEQRLAARVDALETNFASVRNGVDGAPGKDGVSVDAAQVDAMVAKHVAQAIAAIPMPKDGQSVTVEQVVPVITAEVAKAVAAIPAPKDGAPGKDGQSVDMGDVLAAVDPLITKHVEPLVAEKVTEKVASAVAAIPLPKDGERGADGVSVDPADVQAMVAKQVTDAVAAIPPAKDGAPGVSIDPSVVDIMVAAQVERAVAALPKPKDGVSVTTDDVAPVIVAEVAKAVASIPAPKDGVGLASALIDRDGQLVVTLSNGAKNELGPVVGKSVDPADVAMMVAAEVLKIPVPKDGKDGRDGVGFDDLEEELAGDGRTIIRRYRNGDTVKEFRHALSVMLYKGVFQPGTTYQRGDCTTWGGSLWYASEATSAKPGEASVASRAWTLAVKKGGVGQAGQKGDRGEVGPRGEMGPQGRNGF